MGKTISHTDFVKRINSMRPEITFLSEYINAKTKIKCKCKICGHIWDTVPDSLNQGCGCPKCANDKKRKS